MTDIEKQLREQIAQLSARLEKCESELKSARTQLSLVDEAMPAMLAYIDTGERYRYHNRAFREWLGLTSGEIDGFTMREVLGNSMYEEAEPRIKQTLGGRAVRYERMQKTPDGGRYRLFIYFMPHFDENDRVIGIFSLLNNQTQRLPHGAVAAQAAGDAQPLPAESADIQALYDDTLVGSLAQWRNAAARIKSAIANDEFRLYAQTIRCIEKTEKSFCQIYLRLGEEEEAFMHPGAFLPLAESLGLMPEIDRWVVAHILKWVAARRQADPARKPMSCCVILSAQTLSDPYFAEYVRAQLALFEVPGEALRFEMQEVDVNAQPVDAASLIDDLARLGCFSVLGGFGSEKVSFAILKDIRARFLKIDSNIVLQMLRDSSAVAKLKAISRVAKTVGIETIAEFVESDEMLEKLREIGIGYVQGLVISQPRPLSDIA